MSEHVQDIPLFREMEGVATLPRNGWEQEDADERVRVITDIYRTLTELGVAPKLAQQADELAEGLYPLMTLQYNRAPNWLDEDYEPQGRGIAFDVDTPLLTGVDKVSVYLRGIGNPTLVYNDGRVYPYPGFPDDLTRMFFDLRNESRIWGAQSMPTALMEFYNAASVFAAHARACGWTDISEAIRAGAVIPIGVGYDEGLTHYLESMLDDGLKHAGNEKDRRMYGWDGNRKGFGYVLEVVPSIRRLKVHRTVVNSNHGELIDRVGRPEVWETIQRSFIENLKHSGAFLSAGSAHLQNVHWMPIGARTSMVFGDYADFVFLGDYTDAHAAHIFKNREFHTEADIMSAILFSYFIKYDGLTGPELHEVPRLTPLEQRVCTARSWNVILEGISNPKTIDTLVEMSLTDKSDTIKRAFSLAASQLLINRYRSDTWYRVAQEREEQIRKEDPRYTLSDRWIGDILTEIHAPEILERYETTAKSQLVKTIREYLLTGDEGLAGQIHV